MTDGPANGGVTTVIESLGVYLPPREVTTEDVVRGCRSKVLFPLERLTGIKARRVAGETEFAIDLARQAVLKCLAVSRCEPGDIDLVISACIARVDGPGFQVSYEPSTALRLKKMFGFGRALAFDVRSACSGMWVGLTIADTLIRRSVIARALVVSGEYITHLTTTAQLEIEDHLDTRLACLTLGDAGAAVLVEGAVGNGTGFAALDLCTFGGYAEYCVAMPTDRAHGGGIMYTDAINLTDAAARHGTDHALATLKGAGWPHGEFHHLIMHQTSRTALTGAMRAINRAMRREVCHDGNTVNNLARRGNTATTSHFVALADQIAAGRIRSGDRIIFAVSGSGITLGTALYTMDDLPDRLARARLTSDTALGTAPGAPPAQVAPGGTTAPTLPPAAARAPMPRVRVAGIGTAPRDGERRDSLTLLALAARGCLGAAGWDPDDVGLIIYAGVYRTGFVTEPAMAALLAGRIGVNATAARDGRHTLAFDVCNGAVGVLNACWVAAQLIAAGKTRTALVATAEVENNAVAFPDDLIGVEQTGSALLLTAANGDGAGFGAFHFRSFPEHSEAFVSHLTNREGKAWLRVHRNAELERRYVDAAAQTVLDWLREEGRDIAGITQIFASQISPSFLAALAAALGVPGERLVDVTRAGLDLSTSSLALALRTAQERGLVRRGDTGLVVSVGAGIEVGCARYHF